MQFQQSVFCGGFYVSYLITTEDKSSFHFKVKGCPPDVSSVPDNFNVTCKNGEWIFDTTVVKDYESEIVKILKKALA